MKIEFDLPNFEKEVSINIVIKKDGKTVITEQSSSSSIEKPKSTSSGSGKKSVGGSTAGNMMGADF